jgi:hypothetical protein
LWSLLTPLSIHCPCLPSCHFHHSPKYFSLSPK